MDSVVNLKQILSCGDICPEEMVIDDEKDSFDDSPQIHIKKQYKPIKTQENRQPNDKNTNSL